MAKTLRPRMLAAAFGAYFALIAVASYMNASSLSGPWYRGDLTRWVYMSYLVGAAALLAGAGAVAVIRIQYIDRRLAEMNEAIEAAGATGLAEAVRIPADAADVQIGRVVGLAQPGFHRLHVGGSGQDVAEDVRVRRRVRQCARVHGQREPALAPARCEREPERDRANGPPRKRHRTAA